MGKVYLSQRLDALAECLVEELLREIASPFQEHWILIPHPSLKQRLSIEIGNRTKEKICAGCKFLSPHEFFSPPGSPCPNFIEMFCLVYNALREETDPGLLRYLQSGSSRHLELTAHLSSLFLLYGQYGKKLFEKKKEGWQGALLEKLFVQGSFRLPVQIPLRVLERPIHCFGFDFLPEIFWEALCSNPFFTLYLFSPCSHFWEDTRTRWEQKQLDRYWKQKGVSEQSRSELTTYLAEAPSLLANWGRIGRETLQFLDQWDLEIEEAYAPFAQEPTLLHAVQRDLLSFESTLRSSSFLEGDLSLQISLAGGSRLKEVEKLKRDVIRLVSEKNLSFSEISVFGPDIQPYAPLISFVFGGVENPIPYRISQVEMGWRSSLLQGMYRLADLATESWKGEEVVALFGTPSFYRRQGWAKEKVEIFRDWGIQIFRTGDWEKTFAEWIDQNLVYFPNPLSRGKDPLFLEEFFEVLHSLQSDLQSLSSTPFSLAAWAEKWEAVVEKYIDCDAEEEATAVDFLRRLLRSLREADRRLQGSPVPFEVFRHFLKRRSYQDIHGAEINAVRFGSLEMGAIYPAKAIFLIGMGEEHFPRREERSSLDLLKEEKVFVPTKAEEDRYLLLQTLFAAKEYLHISYCNLSEEGKILNPSLLVEELIHFVGAEKIPLSAVPKKGETSAVLFPSLKISSPEPKTREEGRVLSLSDLSFFARHPWKFYLQKHLGIFLEEQEDTPFALQRFSFLRSSLRWPIEKVLLAHAPEFPPGPIGKALQFDCLKKADHWKQQLEGQSLLSLSFLETCREKRWVTKDHLELPPIELEKGVRIIGEVQWAVRDGFLHLGEDAISGALRAWPEILATSIALESRKIYFLKSGKTRTLEEPTLALEAFLDYYFRCSSSLSPLIVDWIDPFLRKGIEEFDGEIRSQDPIVQWVLFRLGKFPKEQLFEEWGWLKETFSSLIALYPQRKGKSCAEV